MSSPQLRRKDRVLGDADTRELIAQAYCGRLATVSNDGWPYIVPLLHVYSGDEIGLHNTAARGHLRANVEGDPRAGFEVDKPVKVFDYGRFECDTGLAYRSAIAYGRIHVVDNRAAKIRFFDALLAKYGTGAPGRPKSLPAAGRGHCVRTQRGTRDRKVLSTAARGRAVACAGSDQVAERTHLTRRSRGTAAAAALSTVSVGGYRPG